MNPQVLLPQNLYPATNGDEVVISIDVIREPKDSSRRLFSPHYEAFLERIHFVSNEMQKLEEAKKEYESTCCYQLFGKHIKVLASCSIVATVASWGTVVPVVLWGPVSTTTAGTLIGAASVFAGFVLGVPLVGDAIVDSKMQVLKGDISIKKDELSDLEKAADVVDAVSAFQEACKACEKGLKEEDVPRLFRAFEAVQAASELLAVDMKGDADSPVAWSRDLGKLVLMDEICQKLKGSQQASKWQSCLQEKLGIELWASLNLENPAEEVYATFFKHRSYLKTICLADTMKGFALKLLQESAAVCKE